MRGGSYVLALKEEE